jgi:hypothetical protein
VFNVIQVHFVFQTVSNGGLLQYNIYRLEQKYKRESQCVVVGKSLELNNKKSRVKSIWHLNAPADHESERKVKSHSFRGLQTSAQSGIICINSSKNRGGLECFLFAAVSKIEFGCLLN